MTKSYEHKCILYYSETESAMRKMIQSDANSGSVSSAQGT